MKLEATPRERVKRGADAPVERQKAAGLAGCRSGHFGPLHDSNVNPAAAKSLIELLTSPTGAAVLKSKGMDPA